MAASTLVTPMVSPTRFPCPAATELVFSINHSVRLSFIGSFAFPAPDQFTLRRLRRPFAVVESSAASEDDDSNEHLNDQEYPSFVRYSWSLYNASTTLDPSLLADTLLELGAAVASVVPRTPIDITNDETFATTGKVRLQDGPSVAASSVIEFWITGNGDSVHSKDDIQAKSLVQEATSLCLDEEDSKSDVVEIQRIGDEDDKTYGHSFDALNCRDTDESTASGNKLIVNNQELSIISSLGEDDEVWAFGDGCHTTTKLSLRGIEDYSNKWYSQKPFTLLDMGCGTGILALAGLALGAGQRVTAVDISVDALRLTKENLQRNVDTLDVEDVEVVKSLSDSTSAWEGSYDAVVANIPSSTLISLLPTLSTAVHAKGKVMSAGYPSSEMKSVTEAANKCALKEKEGLRRYESGWVLQVFVSDDS